MTARHNTAARTGHRWCKHKCLPGAVPATPSTKYEHGGVDICQVNKCLALAQNTSRRRDSSVPKCARDCHCACNPRHGVCHDGPQCAKGGTDRNGGDQWAVIRGQCWFGQDRELAFSYGALCNLYLTSRVCVRV